MLKPLTIEDIDAKTEEIKQSNKKLSMLAAAGIESAKIHIIAVDLALLNEINVLREAFNKQQEIIENIVQQGHFNT